MELTIAQKLDALLKLQNIDSQLNQIRKMRGDLPEEIQDLEDEIAGYQTRIGKYKKEIVGLEEEISQHKQAKKESDKLIAKYKEQQMNVRNNREYEAISKEIELQELEIQLSDKKIGEANYKISRKQEDIANTDLILAERRKDLGIKKAELNVLIAESHDEEEKLLTERKEQQDLIEERLWRPYDKIRLNATNGLAVVMVKRGACGGCFNLVPPQRQAEIREKKKIIVCEHCGRILADVEEMASAIEREREKNRRIVKTEELQ
jgi:predicted  nucleic acid-binding Zn-ribbon protein